MLKDLYNAIRTDAEPTILNTDGRNYSDKQIYPIHAPLPEPIKVSTLTGLAQYLNANVDGLEIPQLICHVVSPEMVEVRSSLLGEFKDRACYIRAELRQMKLPFNQWMDSEAFNIAMQSCFTDAPAATSRAEVLKYISSVAAVAESGMTDDGISQAVTVKAGIASKAMSILPNPVTLRPFRTFTEVEQPASQFVFRCRQDKGIQYMLAEADGGAWRSEAMRFIQEFMENAVQGLNVIA